MPKIGLTQQPQNVAFDALVAHAKAQPIVDFDLTKPKKGLISSPDSPLTTTKTPSATAVSATKVGAPFTSFMKVETYDVEIQRSGKSETVRVSTLRGPGDNSTMVVPVLLDENGKPRITVKGGSTRAAMELRKPGQYVSPGMVGGFFA